MIQQIELLEKSENNFYFYIFEIYTNAAIKKLWVVEGNINSFDLFNDISGNYSFLKLLKVILRGENGIQTRK